VSHLVTAFVLVTTITLATVIGIGAGYFIITGILSVFARKPRRTKAAPALVTQGVTGD
jgi:hypothetical protein